jgi:hypothetical protein
MRSVIYSLLFILILAGCSKKTHPSSTKMESATTNTKAYEKKSPKAVFPKVISVNDSAAHKSVDGRLYYDVMGHRYWRNYKDGKYYLFNKSMYNDPAFKPGYKK